MRFLRIDRFGTPLGDVEGVLEARRKRDVGGTDTLELTMTGPLEKDDRVVARDSKGRWCEWICTSPQGERKDNVPPYGTCVLQGSVRELSRKMHVEVRNRNASARSALEKCLQGTRWEVGTVDVANTASVSYYHENAYQALIDLCKAFECEYEASYVVSGNYVTRRIISLYDRRGSASVAHRFEYGRDLPGVVRTVADDDVVTRLYGYGKGTPAFDEAGDFTGGYHRRISFADINGGKEYVENSSLVNTWGMVGPNGTLVPAEGVVFFNDCEDPAELLTLTRKELERHSAPIVEYQCDVIALARAGEDFEGADIGDTIRVVDSSFPVPVRIEARVLKIDESLTDGIGGTKLTIGNATETYTQRTAAALQTLQDLESMYKAWNEAAGSFPTYLNQVLLGLNTTINDSGGWTYLVPGLGLVTYDVEVSDPAVGAEASMVTEMRGGALRFANSRDSSGNWEFRTVLVPGHVAADMVTAGQITAGYIGDPNGYNYWDLDNDTLRVAANITAGGANNRNGTITVLDAAGNVICLLDNNGIWAEGQLVLVVDGYSTNGKISTTMGIVSVPVITATGKTTEEARGLYIHETGDSPNDDAYIVLSRSSSSSHRSLNIASTGNIVLTPRSTTSESRANLTLGNNTGAIQANPSGHGYDEIGIGSNGPYAYVRPSGTGYHHGIYFSTSGSQYGGELKFNGTTLRGWEVDTTVGDIGTLDCDTLRVSSYFWASGTKNRLVGTEDYGDVLLYSYETASPMFGDAGSSEIGEDGTVTVPMSPVFAEAARVDLSYQVFLQKCGMGDLWVSRKGSDGFVVEGTPGLAFDWEAKARQAGFENVRLERADQIEAQHRALRGGVSIEDNAERNVEAQREMSQRMAEEATATYEDFISGVTAANLRAQATI